MTSSGDRDGFANGVERQYNPPGSPSMSPDSLILLQPYIARASKVRGEAYAAAGRVRFTTKSAEGLAAEVLGSEGSLYTIRLKRHGRALDVSCDCPFFEREGEICKHIWATIIEAVNGRLFGDDVFDEFHGHEGIERDERDGPEPAGFERWGSGRQERSRSGFPSLRAVPRIPQWKEHLQRAGRTWRATQDRILPAVFEVRYSLTISGYGTGLDIRLRTPKTSGELSKPRPVDIPIEDLGRVPDPRDRQILAFFALKADRYDPVIRSHHDLERATLRTIIPAIAETGRLTVTFPAGETAAVTWSELPWLFVLAVRRGEASYELTGVLRRNGEQQMVRGLTMGGGVVLVENELAPVDDNGAENLALMCSREDPVSVPLSDGEELLRTLMTCSPLPELELPEELAIEIKRPDPRPILRLAKHRYHQGLAAKVAFDYNGLVVESASEQFHEYDAAARHAIVRDPARERTFLAQLLSVGLRRAYGNDFDVSTKQLWRALPALISTGWQVEGTEGAYRTGGSLSMAVSSGIDWFDVDVQVAFGEAQPSLSDLLAAVRRGDAFVPLDDGSLGFIDEEWRARLEPFAESTGEPHEGSLRFRRNQALLLDTLLAGRDDVAFDEVFSRARDRIGSVTAHAEEPPHTFRGTLRPYQKEGLGWMRWLQDLGFGGCLADDMGLGKTVQVLAMLEARRLEPLTPRLPSLVVAPRSLIFNWKSEAARFTPELRILDHASPQRSKNHEGFSAADVVLTTYGTLRRDATLFAAAEFDYAILDEAQAIKNFSSISAKAARLLRARHRLALSGTPIENHIGELWSLFEYLNPGMLGSGTRIPALLKTAGVIGEEADRARAVVSRAVRPFILRRTKSEVARELPDRIEQTLLCDLEAKQQAVYDALRDTYRHSLLQRVREEGMQRSRMHVLEALLRLRQAACHPVLVAKKHATAGSAKIETLLAELEVLLEERHKVLVFSQFTSFLALIRAALDERRVAYEYLDGRTRDRAARVERFQTDPDVPLFLISLKAGGLGLNLTAAEYVFLLDPWWNPAVEAQAIDRAHRIGQQRTVMAYRLVARNTIEEKILQLQAGKRALADAILTEDNSILGTLSLEDLDLLLS